MRWRLVRAALASGALGAAAAGAGCSGGGGPPATAAPATATSTAAEPPPVVTARPARKSIDGVLLAADQKFHGIVEVPAAAELRSADPKDAIYELTGPFADVIAFYQRHHPDAASTELPNGVKLIVTPPGADYYTIRLMKVAFERTRILITATTRFPSAPAP
jgi:hypothetical protein